MSAVLACPPASGEYAPYYERYLTLVPEGDILATLDRQGRETVRLLQSLTDDQATYRYAPDKWSLKGVVGHVVDTERAFSYRVLAAARRIEGEISSFDQDETALQARFDERTLDELIDEFASVRRATLSLCWPLDEDALSRKVVANGDPVTARALMWIIAGHERHHVQVLRERYDVAHAPESSDG